MEVYAECFINNEEIETHRSRISTAKLVRRICMVIWALLFIAMWVLPVFNPETLGFWAIVFNFLLYLGISLPFIALFLILGKYMTRKTTEYDYNLNGSNISITKVIGRKKRKKMFEAEFSNIENMGRMTSENYDRYAQNKNIKKVAAVCQYEEDDEIFYIYIKDNLGDVLLHIRPDEPFRTALKRAAPRMSVIDKSFFEQVKENTGDL
ncbi:MAG: hypothetical protein FWC11_03225 [Firmicutes bacterium]|nr:hypothetical protein [Bacillota bacterium]MCL2255853.1 hypothetical protein [Bacillota bacterium]